MLNVKVQFEALPQSAPRLTGLLSGMLAESTSFMLLNGKPTLLQQSQLCRDPTSYLCVCSHQHICSYVCGPSREASDSQSLAAVSWHRRS